MTKKSAASAKVKKDEEKKPSAIETFDNMKQVMLNTAEVALTLSKQPRNMVNVRLAMREWFDRIPAIEDVVSMTNLTVDTYEKVVERIKEFDFEEFSKEEMKDYFEGINYTAEDIITDVNLFRAKLIDDIVRPWGERMSNMHYTILDAIKKE